MGWAEEGLLQEGRLQTLFLTLESMGVCCDQMDDGVVVVVVVCNIKY